MTLGTLLHLRLSQTFPEPLLSPGHQSSKLWGISFHKESPTVPLLCCLSNTLVSGIAYSKATIFSKCFSYRGGILKVLFKVISVRPHDGHMFRPVRVLEASGTWPLYTKSRSVLSLNDHLPFLSSSYLWPFTLYCNIEDGFLGSFEGLSEASTDDLVGRTDTLSIVTPDSVVLTW